MTWKSAALPAATATLPFVTLFASELDATVGAVTTEGSSNAGVSISCSATHSSCPSTSRLNLTIFVESTSTASLLDT